MYAKNFPVVEAICDARAKFPVMAQAIPRRTRPPSRGKPGTRLKAASRKLIHASQPAVAVTISFPWTNFQISPKQPARKRLERGPAMAMLNSCFALSGSFSIRESPPKMNSVIDATGMR